MGSSAWCIFLSLLCSLAISSTAALEHGASLKSFDGLRAECSQYLPASGNAPEDCSDRCVGLVGNFWNDTIGRSSNSIARFYQPDPCDQDYINRTLTCMCDTVLPLPRRPSCQRATQTLQCYRDQFGQLINQVPLYVPYKRLQGFLMLGQCAQMLQIPGDRFGQIMDEGYDKSADGQCLMRCFLIRAGLYSDCGGPDIKRFSLQCEGYGPEYEQSVANCYAELKKQQLDSCTLATRMLYECVQANQYSASSIVGSISLGGVTATVTVDLGSLVANVPVLGPLIALLG